MAHNLLTKSFEIKKSTAILYSFIFVEAVNSLE